MKSILNRVRAFFSQSRSSGLNDAKLLKSLSDLPRKTLQFDLAPGIYDCALKLESSSTVEDEGAITEFAIKKVRSV